MEGESYLLYIDRIKNDPRLIPDLRNSDWTM